MQKKQKKREIFKKNHIKIINSKKGEMSRVKKIFHGHPARKIITLKSRPYYYDINALTFNLTRYSFIATCTFSLCYPPNSITTDSRIDTRRTMSDTRLHMYTGKSHPTTAFRHFADIVAMESLSFGGRCPTAQDPLRNALF